MWRPSGMRQLRLPAVGPAAVKSLPLPLCACPWHSKSWGHNSHNKQSRRLAIKPQGVAVGVIYDHVVRHDSCVFGASEMGCQVLRPDVYTHLHIDIQAVLPKGKRLVRRTAVRVTRLLYSICATWGQLAEALASSSPANLWVERVLTAT